MSLSLLLDADTQKQLLADLLHRAGHSVVTANDLGISTQPDSIVMAVAAQSGRIVVTKNCIDYEKLSNDYN